MIESGIRTSRRAVSMITLGVALVLVVAACSSAGGGPLTSTSATGAPSTSAGSTVAPDASPTAAGPGTGAVLTQAWATAELTDVRNGTTFRIADLVASNKVVFIETMAIWCSNCRAQQRDVVKALAGLDPARVVWIGIDVEASESASDLADYSRSLGFDWPYVIGDQTLLRALAAEFGDQVLSPPSTPIAVIGTDGTVTLTEFGHKSVDRITELAASHGA
ncbi:MAG: hypothetical protein ABI573_07205 [Chloroflexota bacterium]